jgi:hypothetical protein
MEAPAKLPILKRPSLYLNVFIKPVIQAKVHGFGLRSVQNNTGKIGRNTILAFATLRNEAPRIPYFLEHYRRLGVGHFLFVDNGSTDNFHDLVTGQNDISVWRTEASYKASNFGMHWLNALLGRYGVGHWCVTVDPDELLIYPFYETRDLTDLTSWLETHRRVSMFCLVLDMYSNGPVAQAHCAPGQNPLQVAPYFDGNGYVQTFATTRAEVFTQGGPRRRIFFRQHPAKAPAINKTSLVKWRKGYNYLSSMHTHSHKVVNRPHGKEDQEDLLPTGCLLHFKFLSVLAEKAKEEVVRREHYDNSNEYIAYKQVLDSNEDNLFYEHSLKFENSAQLIELGFMHRGTWF